MSYATDTHCGITTSIDAHDYEEERLERIAEAKAFDLQAARDNLADTYRTARRRCGSDKAGWDAWAQMSVGLAYTYWRNLRDRHGLAHFDPNP